MLAPVESDRRARGETAASRGGVLLADELADALVIKNDRCAAGTNENCNAIAGSESGWVIDFEAVTADKFDGKWAEWPALVQRVQGTLEILDGHGIQLYPSEGFLAN